MFRISLRPKTRSPQPPPPHSVHQTPQTTRYISCAICYLLFTICYLLFSPSPALALDTLNYFLPSSGKDVHLSSGEVFKTVPQGSGFVIYKSLDTSLYERFKFDGGFIYHLEDTTWATEAGPVKCNGTNDNAAFTLLDGNYGAPNNVCQAYNANRDKEGMKWVPREMNVGDQASFDGTVVGINKRTGTCCEAPFSGPGGGHVIKLEYQGCIKFPTGAVSKDGIVLKILAGAGAGENFFYDRNVGWVGFNRGTPGSGNYIIDPLDTVPASTSCLDVTIEPGGPGRVIVFTPKREITTQETSSSLSDFVDLHDFSPVIPIGAVPPLSYNYGGHYGFRNQTIPFAQELVKYIAGPFAYQGPTKILEALNQGNFLNFRPLVNLTTPEFQDTLRRNYWESCGSGAYVSDPPENSECLVADGTKIQDITPPPLPRDYQIYEEYQRARNDWYKSPNRLKWAQVPLVSNPLTKVEKATTVQGCRIVDGKPAESVPSVNTIVETKTPWVSALKDVSAIYGQFMTSREEGRQAKSTLLATTNPYATDLKSKNKPQVLAALPADLSPEAMAKGKALAQAGQNCNPSTEPPHLSLNLSASGNSVNWTFCTGDRNAPPACAIRDFSLQVAASTGDSTGFMPGGGSRLTIGQCFQQGDGGTRALSVPAGTTTITVTGTINGERVPGNCTACPKSVSISCTLDLANGTSSCGGAPPPPPTACQLPRLPDNSIGGSSDPISQRGHAASFGGGSVGCETNGGTTCTKEGRETVLARMWATTRYPFLDGIYNNLTGRFGAFNFLKTDRNAWNEPGQSPLSYNFCDSTAPYSGYITEAGRDAPQYLTDQEKQTFGYGGCANDVSHVDTTLTYPNFVGGAKKAKDYLDAATTAP